MNLINVINSLQDINTKVNLVYSNSTWKDNENYSYMETLKKESKESLQNLISDLTSLQRERVGLEIGAWRA